MKTRYLIPLIAGIAASLTSYAQCTVTMNYLGGGCNNTSGSMNALTGFTNCPGANTISWTWAFSNGVTGSQVTTGTQFQIPIQPVPGASQVCFEATVLNSNIEILTTVEQCFPVNPNPVIVTADVIQNASGCGLNDGCVMLSVTGGVPPYTWWFGGVNSQTPLNTSPAQVCNLAAGSHYVIVSDSNGCTTTHTFAVPANTPTGLSGLVFNDLNGNGTQGTGTLAEPAVAGLEFFIVEAGITVYSGSNGYFYVPGLEQGTYTIQYAGDDSTWELNAPFVVQAPGCISIPVQSTVDVYAQNSGLVGWGNTLHCQNGMNAGIWLANSGNAPFSGQITLTGPSNLTYVNTTSGVPASSQNSGTVTWDITSHAPGVLLNYAAHINGPGTSFIGQSFPITISIVLYDGDGNVFYQHSWTINPVVTCAYDPNDKLCMPEGYADPHFILADTDLTYTIRFQNTGNAPAEDVRIEDQLDTEHLDLSSFEPVAASHDYYTTVSPEGLVQFHFDNIMLPDSTNNEAESHGYVMYRIRPLTDVNPGDVIHNFAAIYFDLNEPIITNETWHTIYTCSQLEAESDPLEYCFVDIMSVVNETEYVETYSWSWNGEELSSDAAFFGYASQEGLNQLTLTLSNPLCEVSTPREVFVHPLPDVTLTVEDGLVTASPAGTCTWSIDGVEIEGLQGSSIEASADGLYTVELTDENGCSGIASVTVVNVGERSHAAMRVYPNPLTEQSRIELPQGVWDVYLTESTGREIMRFTGVSGTIVPALPSLAPGVYSIRASGDSGRMLTTLVVIR
jgi:uncharacterized repeat protein (TIGR01451 family)